jgi:quinol monooxygenase YgiN
MITERLSFRAKYGQGDTLAALVRENVQTMPPPAGVVGVRLYTDFTGPMFTVVFEIDHADMDAYMKDTQAQAAEFGLKEFQEWFAKMVACTEVGERQLFNSEKLR